MERPDWVDLDEVEVGSSSADDEVELAEMGIDLQTFEDEEDERTTTAEQVAAGGDPQNIPWGRLQVSREQYRETRLEQYHNYVNRTDVMRRSAAWLREQSNHVKKDGRYYDFYQNEQRVRSDIAHFQLRHLLWATSKHDIYVTHKHCINHWSSLSGLSSTVLDLSSGGEHSRATGFGRVQISTFCISQGLLAVGGFTGELILADAETGRLLSSKRVTQSEMGITNGIDVFTAQSGGVNVMPANNDNLVRIFDAEASCCHTQMDFQWPVNLAVACPCEGSSQAVMVGDYPDSYVMDLRSRTRAATLAGHLDYAFAASWHPQDPHIVATGNQDTSTRVWDLRKPSESVATLCGNMGAIRSLRYSPCGRFLAACEPADFVRLYDVKSGYERCQEIDLFGEIGGITFTPEGSSFFLNVADVVYSSLMEFTIAKEWRSWPQNWQKELL